MSFSLSDNRADPLTPATALIVSAFVKKSPVAAPDLAALIATVHSALANAGEPAPAPPQKPAVSLRRLVTADRLYCAECAKAFKSLKRHLMTSHHLSPSAYLAKWGLKKDHPMVAPTYAASRSALALSFGLGRKGAGKRAAAPKSKTASRASAKADTGTTSAGGAGRKKPASRAKRATGTTES